VASDRGSNNLILHCKCKQILLSRREKLKPQRATKTQRKTKPKRVAGGDEEQELEEKQRKEQHSLWVK